MKKVKLCHSSVTLNLHPCSMETTLNPVIVNQIDNFISNLSTDKVNFRRFLLDMKQAQESELFQLEQEYLALVRDRRTALINYLRTATSTSTVGKKHIHDTLKQMHARTQAELTAFLKIRVYEGWQMGQVVKQREALRLTGFPLALLPLESEGDGIEKMRSLMNYLLLKL